ncbi:MAG: carboxylating nicotinate-nucleotide diphosphorylase [Alphaproteobacteria bacterium]
MHRISIEPIVKAALLEDLGHGSDITSEAVIPAGLNARAVINTREDGVIAGVEVAVLAFRLVDPSLEVIVHKRDGEAITAGDKILTISGSARSITTAERVALNFASHLSGIASATAAYVARCAGTSAKVCCTRKTLPGLRGLQKQAVLLGGGANHRFGLDDAILIKDNHIAMAGGVNAVLDAAQARCSHMMKIEIEVDTLDQLSQVLKHGGADIVLLDNMDNDTLREAVAMVDGTMVCEASGGVNLETVQGIAQTGVDYISVGALTHSVTVLDLGLDIEI